MSDDKDYAHMRDPEAQRTRYELWAIIVIVVVFVVGGLIWRAIDHNPAGHQVGYGANTEPYPANAGAVPAAAGVHSSPPAPRSAP